MRDPSELISAYFDDQLSDAELAELQKWMGGDEAHVRQFVRESLVHSRIRDLLLQREVCDLAFDGDGAIDPDRIVSLLDEEAAVELRRLRAAEAEALRAAEAAARRHELEFDRNSLRVDPPRTPWRWYAGAAVAAALLVGVAQLLLPDPPMIAPTQHTPIVAAAPHAPAVVGKIRRSLDATWSDARLAVDVGSAVVAGEVSLTRGMVEIEFSSGAQIVVEAPTSLQLVSADRVRLQHGRVVVHVPEEALGFTLHSNKVSFVDLGTEFGVEVSESGDSSVQVLDGEVALVRSGPESSEPSVTLKVGAASRVSADGKILEGVTFDRARFIRRVPATAYELAVLKSRPLLYWPLSESTGDNAVESRGRIAASGSISYGVQLGVGGIHGPGSSAARTDRRNGGIELGVVDGLKLTRDFTCEAWVRSNPVAYKSSLAPPQRVLSTFDRDPKPTGFAFGVVSGPWYDMPNDGVMAHFTMHGVYDCISSVRTPYDEWLHLATVIDGQGEPTLYMNGELIEKLYRQRTDAGDGKTTPHTWVAAEDWDQPLIGTVSSGPARLGRNPKGRASAINPEDFQGLMSDVAVYDRALTADEIRQHYEAVEPQPE
jgi:hypothetical protein